MDGPKVAAKRAKSEVKEKTRRRGELLPPAYLYTFRKQHQVGEVGGAKEVILARQIVADDAVEGGTKEGRRKGKPMCTLHT